MISSKYLGEVQKSFPDLRGNVIPLPDENSEWAFPLTRPLDPHPFTERLCMSLPIRRDPWPRGAILALGASVLLFIARGGQRRSLGP